MLDLIEIEKRYEKIKPYLKETPLEESLYLSDENTKAYLKLECLQPVVRNFKLRGVLGKLSSLTEEQLQKGVATVSSGNQGVSLAYGAKLMGIPSPHIYAPNSTPLPKIHKMKHFGANLHLVGDDFDEANKIGTEEIKNNGYTFIDAREDPDGITGTASIGIEILERVPDTDAVIIPVGSGGDLTSNGSYFKQKKPDVKVYGVEVDFSPALKTNLEENKWTRFFTNDRPDTIIGSLTGGCAKHTFDNYNKVCDGLLIVSEEEIRQAVYEMAQNEKVICEPDSAASYAAYKKYRELFENKKTALYITGANISSEVFDSIMKENRKA